MGIFLKVFLITEFDLFLKLLLLQLFHFLMLFLQSALMVPFYKMVHILGFLFRLVCALYSGIFFFHLSHLAMRKVGNLCTRPACYYFHGIVRLKLLFLFIRS